MRGFHRGPKLNTFIDEAGYMTAAYKHPLQSPSCNPGRTIYVTHVPGMDLEYVARPERFELPTAWFVARYSIQLSYGRVLMGDSVGRSVL